MRDLRSEERKPVDCIAELTWKTPEGQKRIEQCRAIDISEGGAAIECSEAIPVSTKIVVWAPQFEVAALAEVCRCSWRQSVYVLGCRFVARTTTASDDPRCADHYEILKLSNHADQETIERVYKTLARRYHPDNNQTGDAEIFLRIAAAYRILSTPDARARYDRQRESMRSVNRFQLSSVEFFSGITGEQNRRLAILCLLYRMRTTNYESAGLSLLDLEQLTGCTREELGFTLWYLCERKLAAIGENTAFNLTAAGVDFVESKLAEGNSDLRLLAAVEHTGGHAPARNALLASPDQALPGRTLTAKSGSVEICSPPPRIQ